MVVDVSSSVGLSEVRVLHRLASMAWRNRRRTFLALVLQCVLLALTLSGLKFTGVAVDIVRHQLDPSAQSVKWPVVLARIGLYSPTLQLVLIGTALAGTALVGAWLNYTYSTLLGQLVHIDIVATTRREVFAKLQQLSSRFLDNNSNSSLINRVTVDVQMIRYFIDGFVIQGSALVLTLTVFLAYMLHAHARLTLISLAPTPASVLAAMLFSRWARLAYREGRRLTDDLVRSMTDGIEGIQVLKVFGMELEQYKSFAEQNARVRDQKFDTFQTVSRFSPVVSLLNQLNIAVLIAYGSVLVARGETSLGELVVFAGLLRKFSSRATSMAEIVNVLQQSLAGARRVFELLDAPNEVSNGEHPIVPPRFSGKIRFEETTFGYDPKKKLVLEGLSVEILPGECLGVFGSTGSGKSSLTRLLPRFYDPTSGSILIDDVDLRRYDLDWLRKQMGVVFQESLLFRDTVANNIAYGHPEASMDQIRAAARLANADQFISALSGGYDTLLDEGATNLSGGQRQRIAIARALLLDPPILILDDPVTAVDPATEAELLRAIRGVVKGRTTLLVSSRLSTLQLAHRILVLENGRATQLGTHAELLERSGPFRSASDLLGTGSRTSAEQGSP